MALGSLVNGLKDSLLKWYNGLRRHIRVENCDLQKRSEIFLPKNGQKHENQLRKTINESIIAENNILGAPKIFGKPFI